MKDDQYKTIAQPVEGFFKDRGSKFLAYAYPAATETDWQLAIDEVKKLHPKARHFCFAFRMGFEGENYRANDDGEPSGTAGRPILGQIDSFELTNVFIVVVRYFGGSLLGASGLIQAYRAAAADALSQAIILEKTVLSCFEVVFDYALMSQVMGSVKQLEIELLDQDFGLVGKIEIGIPTSKVEDTLLQFKASVGNLYIEEAAEIEKIEGLDWTFLGLR